MMNLQEPFIHKKEIQMFTNRFSKTLVAAILIVAALTVREAYAKRLTVSEVDSATRSYTGWAKALESKESNVDSATRSYTAWAKAVETEGTELRLSRLTKSIASESVDDAIESLRTVYASWPLHAAAATISPSADRSYDGIENFLAHGRLP
jgi:hypothetical protein